MAKGVYTVVGTNLTLANQAVTLVGIHTTATGQGSVIEILRAWAAQSGSTASAQIRIQHNTQVTAFPTLVSATPQKTDTGDVVSGITGGTDGATGHAGVNASAEGAGAKTVIIPDAFNQLNGYLWLPTDFEKLIIGPDLFYGLHIPAALAQLANWNFGVTYREIV